MKERDGEADFSNRPIPDNQRYLSIDITFDDNGSSNQSHSPYMNNYMMMGDSPQDVSQTQTHLGLASCRLVQWYIQNYRNLKQVAILMKKFLAIHNYNSPYYGMITFFNSLCRWFELIQHRYIDSCVHELLRTPGRIQRRLLQQTRKPVYNTRRDDTRTFVNVLPRFLQLHV